MVSVQPPIKFLSRQVESDLNANENDDNEDSEEAAAALRKRRQELSERICVLCGQGFSLLFNR